jgi:hypothetical protein
MRRRLEVFIPIVLLSMLVQLIAPVAAVRVVAYALSDPLYMASICSGMSSSTDGAQNTASKTHHDKANCCALCSVSFGSVVAVDPPPLLFVILQRLSQLALWLEVAETLPAVGVGSNPQARAPPQLT